jgi:hypothetical protein
VDLVDVAQILLRSSFCACFLGSGVCWRGGVVGDRLVGL